MDTAQSTLWANGPHGPEASLDALGVPHALREFEPSYQAALARAQHTSPPAYARTRNALDGGVTGLSPYLTHGIISLNEVARAVGSKHRLGYDDKLVFELGWRAFFHHVWSRSPNPEDILSDLRPANLWRGTYAASMPADIREGRSGVPCIDAAVRQLYATGYLHNHARMWLASYCVHLRKVYWRAGADWLYSHLLDGDLPSNHLSWQWVAATFSSKPYLFNASNVAKFAPQAAWKAWASNKTAIDMDYEQLDALARQSPDVGCEPGVRPAVAEPALLNAVALLDDESFKQLSDVESVKFAINNIVSKYPGRPLKIELLHPWCLTQRSSERHAETQDAGALLDNLQAATLLRIGVVHASAHQRRPWSLRRWQFVLQRMQSVCDVVFIGDMALLADLPHWPGKQHVQATATLFEGYRDALPRMATLATAPMLFAPVAELCTSFSKFYERAQRVQPDFSQLLV
jgi:deoxyribodipyrimidine photo-lyase